LAEAAPGDHVLRQSIRIAIRNQLRDYAPARASLSAAHADATKLWLSALRGPNAHELAEIVAAVKTPLAGRLMLRYLRSAAVEDREMGTYLQHAAECLADSDEAVDVVDVARRLAGDTMERRRSLLNAVAPALRESATAGEALQHWAEQLVRADLDRVRERLRSATPLEISWSDAGGNAWPQEPRSLPDGRQISVTSSFPLGEAYTGVLRSDPFTAPAKIQFVIAGHNGYPDQADHRKNRVELIDAQTLQVLRTAYPPRNDALHKVSWQLDRTAGKRVRLRVTDGDSAGAYAWLAFGKLRPSWLQPSSQRGPLRRALAAIENYRLARFAPELLELLGDQRLSPSERADIGTALAQLRGRELLGLLYSSAAAEGLGRPLPDRWAAALADDAPLNPLEEVSAWASHLNAPAQRRFALRLAGRGSMVGVLLDVVDKGTLSADVLVDKEVSDKLSAVVSDSQRERLAQLRQRAQPIDAELQRAMDEALAEISGGRANLAIGVGLFTKHCAACHQLGGLGEVVGPQLDGVGGRGAARLMEDIVMPDRNVDKAFRTTTILTVGGQVLTGLVRSEDDQRLNLVGNDGKPFAIAQEDIELRKAGDRSLMPGNFHDVLQPSELASLVLFLEQSATPQ
jgi:putative heme-binding domain-containing protein